MLTYDEIIKENTGYKVAEDKDDDHDDHYNNNLTPSYLSDDKINKKNKNPFEKLKKKKRHKRKTKAELPRNVSAPQSWDWRDYGIVTPVKHQVIYANKF